MASIDSFLVLQSEVQNQADGSMRGKQNKMSLSDTIAASEVPIWLYLSKKKKEKTTQGVFDRRKPLI